MSSMPGRSDSQHMPFPGSSPYAGMQRYQRMSLTEFPVDRANKSLVTDAPVHDDPSDEISLKSRASGKASYGNRRPTLKVCPTNASSRDSLTLWIYALGIV